MDQPSQKPFDLDTFNEDDLIENRKASEDAAAQFSMDEYKAYRIRAKKDLFFLSYSVLGYDKLAKLHFDLCSWMKENEQEQFREILLPRSHYKSTVCTIAHAIQIVLPDDAGDAPWPLCLGTNCRILLAHEVRDSAALFLNEITAHFLNSPILMALFPECIPDLKKNRVNQFQLELPRNKKWKEPTFSTIGAGARAQGQHFNFIKGDDLIGDKARDSPTEMKSAKLWVDNIQALLVTPKDDKIDFVGTRWSYDDLYNHLHDAYGDKLKKYIRGIEEFNAKGQREIIFPEQFSFDSIAILRKNRKVFSAQYANDPKETADEFQDDWKRYYRWSPNSRLNIEFGDRENTSFRHIYEDLDRCILVDPAMNGLGGICVTGMDEKGNIFVLESLKKAWRPHELVNQVFELVSRWQPRVVGIEHVLFSALFDIIFQNEMARRGVRFQISALKTFQKAKDFRVRGLSHYFTAGQIFFHEAQLDLIEEFDSFGATNNYHMLDALAHGPQVWRPARPGFLKLQQGNPMLALPSGTDKVTGYSSLWDDEDEPL